MSQKFHSLKILIRSERGPTWVLWQGVQRPGITVSVRWLSACSLHQSAIALIIRQFQVHYYQHKFMSWWSDIRCCRAVTVEQSVHTRPSAGIDNGQFLTETENVSNCSRHQRPVTVGYRRCV